VYFLVCFVLPGGQKWFWYTTGHLEIIEPIGLVAVLASVASYGVAAWQRYAEHQRWLTDNLSNREEFRLGWLRLVLLAIASTWVVIAAFFVIAKLWGPLDYFDRLPAILWLAGLVYALGLAGWRFGNRPLPFAGAVGSIEERQTPLASHNDSAAARRSAAEVPTSQPATALEWASRTETAGWWRDPMLTREMLARHLDTSPRTLSRVLNDGLGQSFNEFVNRLRVQAVAAELADASRDRDLLQIAFDAGFNSKASFNRAFKAYTGRTPSDFRQQARTHASQLVPATEIGRSRDA
jgi:AraC-like DNA-binding protein